MLVFFIACNRTLFLFAGFFLKVYLLILFCVIIFLLVYSSVYHTGLGSTVTWKSEVVALPNRLPDRLPTRNAILRKTCNRLRSKFLTHFCKLFTMRSAIATTSEI